jgi:hypothetical protein
VLASAIGLAYFGGTSRQHDIWQRLATSAYGPMIAVLFVVAAFLWPESYRYQPSGVRAFYALQLLPLALLAYSVRFYPGPRSFHFVLVPLGLVAWAWTFALGFLAVHGE